MSDDNNKALQRASTENIQSEQEHGTEPDSKSPENMRLDDLVTPRNLSVKPRRKNQNPITPNSFNRIFRKELTRIQSLAEVAEADYVKMDKMLNMLVKMADHPEAFPRASKRPSEPTVDDLLSLATATSKSKK